MSCVHYQSSSPSKDTEPRYPWMCPVQRSPKNGRTILEDQKDTAAFVEKVQARLRFLEDCNAVTQTRNQNLIEERRHLLSKLEDARITTQRLESEVAALRGEIVKLQEEKEAGQILEEKTSKILQEKGTAALEVPKFDRAVEISGVCGRCQRRFEDQEGITITRSELDELERDMRVLRDAILAREQLWEKANKREEQFRGQLTRLTADAITARHLAEARQEELRLAVDALADKEQDLRTAQKDNQHLGKLMSRLYDRHCRLLGDPASAEITEKDRKLFEEIGRRVASAKSNRQRPKSKSSNSQQSSPRDD